MRHSSVAGYCTGTCGYGSEHVLRVLAGRHPATPASLIICNDGHAFMAMDGDIRAEVVMDNLICRREIPVMTGAL
jgi:hypothetical protein